LNRIICLIGLFVLAGMAAWGQGTAQIHGTVTDNSGAAVPGAEVKATHTETGTARTTVTGSDGGYVLPALATGPYRVEVTKPGFSTAVQTGIVLQVNADPSVDVALKVGQVVDTVNVEANAALVETRNSGVGSVVETQRIIELPLNGRQVSDLVTLNGGAVQTGTTDTRIFSGRPMISIAGMASLPLGGGQVDWVMDGTSHWDFMSGTTMPLPMPDAMQEFKVETSGLAAARGNNASVEMVMRSGTNQLHGDLFEFIRNGGFGSAADYRILPSPTATPPLAQNTYKRNQFGGTVGGAIIKNKLFFFGGYQGTTQRQSPGNSTAVIATADMIQGDFSKYETAACGRPTPLAAPFGTGGAAPNTVTPDQLSAPAVYISQKFLASAQAAGVNPDACGNVVYNTPFSQNNNEYEFKIDYQINDKHSMFFRDLFSKEHQPTLTDLTPNLLVSNSSGFDTPSYALAVGETWVVNANMVNSARLAFTRINATRLQNDFFNYCTAGVQNFWCGENKAQFGALLIVNGYSAGINYSDPPPNGGGSWYRSANYIANDDINYVMGAHQFTFGGSVSNGRFTSRNSFASNGQFNFTGLNNFLIGHATQMQDGLPNTQSMHETFFDLYFTDTWKVSSRLTVNAGIRWEPYLPITVPTGVIFNFDVPRYVAGTRSTQYVNAPPGFYYPGDPGFPDKSGEYKQWANFAPRIGVAWDPFGNGKTSIRSSYGYGYAFVPGLTREDQQGQDPWGGRQILTSTPNGTPNGLGYVNFTNPFGTSVNPYPYDITNKSLTFTPNGLFATTAYNTPSPTYSTWNLAIQRQIGAPWLVSATYMGSKVSHLYISVAENYAVAVPGATAANVATRRNLVLLNPNSGYSFSNVMNWNAGGNQHYEGLLLSAQRRLARNFSVSANWTWSHCIGQALGYNTKPEQTSTDPINYNRVGNCDSDRRNIFNVTAVAQTPKFSNKAMRYTASDWKLSGIYKFTSGTPLMIQDGTDVSASTINHQQPDLVNPSGVYTGQSCAGCFYLNKSAFAPQAPINGVIPYTGNLGWNSVTGPTYWDLDLALSRVFRITERQNIELRGDAFNLFNSFVAEMAANTPFATNYGNPATGPGFALINNNQFGQILGAYPTRKIQFALKYSF
jgi:Carboxypeptidase regulatory-like domain